MSEVMETKEGSRADSSLFVLPRTLDEILVTVLAVAWPLMFVFLLRRDMDLNAAGEALSWVMAFGIQVGILFGLRTARRRGR
jgi:hypothetical protein